MLNEEIILVPPRIPDDVEVDPNDLFDFVALRDEIIRKKGDQWCLYSRKVNPKTGKRRNLGCYDTKEKVKERERQVQFFKRQSLDRTVDALVEGTLSAKEAVVMEFGPAPGITVADTFRFYNRATNEEIAEATRAIQDGDYEKARAIFKKVLGDDFKGETAET